MSLSAEATDKCENMSLLFDFPIDLLLTSQDEVISESQDSPDSLRVAG